ncbi:hypothetical protein OEZ85_005727 [Tetradesmus obliquus]|uniref:RING-type E3 ubiquitin transferase (cysteine targeting) n=1 Tax=Tetradesmus obliquus TaxID=3088 RepID=A0ABY8UFJ3_TETOB|nr:hypothetical protein OEZ85_005727 [Tetradesmus obliquus]
MELGATLPAALHSPAAEAWQVEFAKMLPELERLSNTQLAPWPLRVLRSSQLDAHRLDAELTTMLQEQFMAAFTLFQPGRVSNLAPELNLLLAGLVYWLSIWQGRATPGSELMNLRYRNEHAMEAAAAAAAAAGVGGCSGSGGSSAVQPPSWLHGGRTGLEGPGLSQQQKLGYAAAFVGLPYLWLWWMHPQ